MSEIRNETEESSFEKFEAEYLQDRYETLEKIGQGSYAQVIKAREKFGSRQLRAIKRIQMNPLAQEIEQISRLKVLKSDHIIEFYGYIIAQGSNELNVIMELCKGSLRDQIKQGKYFGPGHIMDLITQVTSAMLNLNDKFIMHLDLKPQNILFDQDNFYKLCDFGCAQLFQNISKMASVQRQDKNRMLSSVGIPLDNCLFGTPRYIAPEVQLGIHHVGKNSCDMWSLGIILYEIIYEKHPFELQNNGRVRDKDFKKFVTNKLELSFPQTKEKYPIELLKMMLKPNPIDRLTWRKLKEELISKHDRHESQFLNVHTIARSQLKMSLVFASITMTIEDCLDSSLPLWKKNQDLLKELKKTLMLLGYGHLVKFYHLFEYKMKNKLASSILTNFQFLFQNIQDQIFEDTDGDNFNLKSLDQLESRLRQILNKIKLKLSFVMAQSREIEKLNAFISDVEKLKQGQDLFCKGHLFVQTCKLYNIVDDQE